MIQVTIIDQRPIIRTTVLPQGGYSGGGVTDHEQLTGRDADDQHPIGAITGLSSEIELAQKAIAGIVDFNLTAVAGTTHTITIIPEHSGKTLDVRANLDDVVTILVGNDIVLNQPVTIRKTGVFSVELRAANTDIVIEANDVLDDAGVDYVDISGETFNTVQVMKASDNVIWGIGI